MVESMDYVKFICRDLWLLLFKKQADRLQTNHKVRTSGTRTAPAPLLTLCTRVRGRNETRARSWCTTPPSGGLCGSLAPRPAPRQTRVRAWYARQPP